MKGKQQGNSKIFSTREERKEHKMRFCKYVGWNTLAAAAAAVVMLFAARGTMAGITGSAHDFKTQTWNPGGEICKVCHAPHNSTSTTLLWNHTASTATYTLYSSSTLNATLGQPAAGSVSKLCLSCHDGTVALDSFGGTTGTTFLTWSKRLGTDLSNDHPIGFTYDAALATADGGLATPTSASLVVANVPLYSAKLECASCHDVHNAANIGNLLRTTNSGSALCLKCHTK